MCVLLLSKGKADDSIVALDKIIKRKNINLTDVEKDKGEFEMKYCEEKEEKSDSIYRNSEFYERYQNIKCHILQEINNNERGKVECIENKYAPEIIEITLKRWMPYAVLWTAMDLDMVDPSISRVTNAYIESSNKVMKDMVFQNMTNISIADRIRQLKNNRSLTMGKIKLNDSVKDDNKSATKSKYKEVKKSEIEDDMEDPALNPFPQESWKKKKTALKRGAGYADVLQIKKLRQHILKEKEMVSL